MDTLVLSSSYEPVGQVSWKRAIRLWLLDKVEVLEEYTDRVVQCALGAIAMPSVIRLLKAIAHRRRRGPRFSRENVYAREKGRCAYCGTKVSRIDATYDHVVPRALGGKTTWENIVIACMPCNQRKGGRTPEQARMKLRTKPVRPHALPGTHTLGLPKGSMPESWRQYLSSMAYWHLELDDE